MSEPARIALWKEPRPSDLAEGANAEAVTVPLTRAAERVLNDFLVEHKDELIERLAAVGGDFTNVLRPEWRQFLREDQMDAIRWVPATPPSPIINLDEVYDVDPDAESLFTEATPVTIAKESNRG